MLRLLLVEDEKNLRVHMLGGVPWERLGICAVQGAAGSDEAYAAFETFQPDILLTDIRIPGENGIEMARRMLSKKPDLRVIFMSAYSDADYLRSALQIRSVDYLFKPVQPGDLEEALKQAIASRDRLQSEQDRRQLVENHAGDLLQSLLMRVLLADGSLQELLAQLNVLPFPAVAGVYMAVELSALPEFSVEMHRACVHCLPLSQLAYSRLVALPDGRRVLFCCFERRPDAQQLEEAARRLHTLLQVNGALAASVRFSALVESIAGLYGFSRTASVLRARLEQRPRVAALCEQMVELIQARYQDRRFSAGAIAQELHYTNAYVCTVFKQKYGITIQDYINAYRIAKAKELLKNPAYTMAAIAEKVGYENDSYFSRVFKRLEGTSPSDYRRRRMG